MTPIAIDKVKEIYELRSRNDNVTYYSGLKIIKNDNIAFFDEGESYEGIN